MNNTESTHFLTLFASIFLMLSLALLTVIRECNQTPSVHTDIDSKAYLANADLFYHNHSFAWPAPHNHEKPYYVLGYPFIMSILFMLFGQHSTPLIFFNIFLSLLCLFMLYATLAPLNKRAALIGAGLVSSNLGFLTFSQFVLAEITLVFFLLLFFMSYMQYLTKRSDHALYFSAVALGLSILIKPAALYFPLLLLPLLALNLGKADLTLVEGIKKLGLWLALFCLPLGLYAFHQKIVFGEAYVCKLDTENMLNWYYPNVRAALYQTDANLERQLLKAMPQESVLTLMKQDLSKHPFVFILVGIKNIIKTWLGLFSTNLKLLIEPTVHGGDISFFKTTGSWGVRLHSYITSGTEKNWMHGIAYLESFWLVFRFIFIVFGFLFLFVKKHGDILAFFSSYLFYFSVITGHDGCARFRMLIEPELIMLISLGIIFLLETKKPVTLSEKV